MFVKPNFTFPRYKEGVTTNPILLKELLAILKDRADRVILGESNGGRNSFTAYEAFRGHRMDGICKELGVELVNLTSVPAKLVKDKVLNRLVYVYLPKLLLDEVDAFVSVPVLKVHAMTSVTMNIKNLWGCYLDPMRCLHHDNIDRKLALMVRELKPRICIIDSEYALDNHGPMFGTPVKMNLMIASNNPVVADSIGASVMGFNPREIGHIRTSEDMGLGTTELERVVMNDVWERHHRTFSFHRTVLDTLSLIPFKSSKAAKFLFDSPFSDAIRRVVDIVRTSEEREDLRSYVI